MGIKKVTKTMRINRRDFFMLTIMTPLFAAVVAAVLVLGIAMPSLKNGKIEVPLLGGNNSSENTPVNAEVQITRVEPKEEDKTEKTEEKPAETATTTPTTTQAQRIPSTIIRTPAKTQTETKKTEENNNTKKSEEPAKAQEKVEEKKEDPAKTACEARTDGPTSYIRVHYLSPIEKVYALFSGKEDPIIDYYRAELKEGATTKMEYKNGSCVPTLEGFEVIDDIYLEESDLESYNITAKTDYEIWN